MSRTALKANARVSSGAGHLTIKLHYDQAAQEAPASFRNAIQSAANILSSVISDPISVNIRIGYGDVPFFGDALTNGEAEGGPQNVVAESYSALRSQLINHASTVQVSEAANALPNSSTLNGEGTFDVAFAEARALGLAPASSRAVDGDVGFATDIPLSNLVGVALHEITHAMGRMFGSSVLDLFRYTSPNVHDFSSDIPTVASYLSLDNGTTHLADFGQSSDPSDFLNSALTPNDPYNEFYDSNTLQSLTSIDQTVLGLLGFDIAPHNH